MTQVITLNTSNLGTGTDVEVHSPTCDHIKRYARHPFFEAGYVEDWGTPQALFNVYNDDFYAEGGNDACWPIHFFPCTGLVKKTTTISEYVA